MRLCVVITAICLCVVGLSVADDVHASIRKQTSIPAEGLGPALQTLAKERNFQIVYVSEEVNALHTQGAIGEFTTEEALDRLLKGTGLTYRFFGENAISVIRVTGASEAPPSTSAVDTQPSSRPDENSNEKEGKKSFWDSFRLAQANQGAPQRSSTVGSDVQGTSGSSENSPRLTEILVTAQKKTERLQDVPIAITVLDPQALAENGQNRLLDYFASVPGLNVSGNASWGGTQYLTIRGISAGVFQTGTVATVIDDVPVTASTYLAQGMLSSPDLDPSDLARIEVLKGPQGTLYGADSLSGLIKYVTVDPSTSGFNGRVEVGGIDIARGGVGYVVRGAANVPVSDTFAYRVSAFSRRDPGYIDDLTTGQSNFNSSDVYGGHLGALWRPSDNLSVKLSALIQEAHGDDSLVDSDGFGHFTAGDLKVTGLPGTTRYSTQAQLYSATVNAKVAGVDIVSVTGYVVNTFVNWKDYTGAFGTVAYACVNPPFTCNPSSPPAGSLGAPSFQDYTTHKVSEELRVSSSIGRWLDWRLAGFYTHENSPTAYQNDHAADPTTGAVTASLFRFSDALTFSEYAIFGDVTAHVTDQFDIELGGREGWYKQTYQETDTGIAEQYFNGGPPPPVVGPLDRTDANNFTYQVTPRLKISPDLMVYARVATGYRIGGPNPAAYTAVDQALGIPLSYAPDRSTNYELGIKGNLFERKLSFDAAAYYIDWKNFQIGLSKGIYPYTANAGNAKSEGLELSIEAHPVQGLTITAVGSFDDAVLTQDLPASSSAYGLAGDRLPYSMRVSSGLTVNQDIRLSQEWVGFVGGSVNYVGSRPYEFLYSAPPPPRAELPAYTQFNLHAGAHYDSWLINLYVNNVADRRGIVGLIPSYSAPELAPGGYNAAVIQPRTVGLGISRTF